MTMADAREKLQSALIGLVMRDTWLRDRFDQAYRYDLSLVAVESLPPDQQAPFAALLDRVQRNPAQPMHEDEIREVIVVLLAVYAATAAHLAQQQGTPA
ncbi:MAG: hypothetical protein NTZ05_23125 [Chloroflexi bacterium]|nr:hypothetical protein [Chloroflexota bacterium]